MVLVIEFGSFSVFSWVPFGACLVSHSRMKTITSAIPPKQLSQSPTTEERKVTPEERSKRLLQKIADESSEDNCDNSAEEEKEQEKTAATDQVAAAQSTGCILSKCSAGRRHITCCWSSTNHHTKTANSTIWCQQIQDQSNPDCWTRMRNLKESLSLVRIG